MTANSNNNDITTNAGAGGGATATTGGGAQNPTVAVLMATQTGQGRPNGGAPGAVVNLNAAADGGAQVVQRAANADGTDLNAWTGLWPGPTGKIAKDMSKNGGTLEEQKEKAEQLFTFLATPNSPLQVIAADDSPVAYLLHDVTGSTKVRAL